MYGYLDNDAVSASFALDGGEAVPQSVDSPPSPEFNWPFFSTSPPLALGVHELMVTLNGGTFNLDYLVYTGDSTNPVAGTGDASAVQSLPIASKTASPSNGKSLTSPGQKLSDGAIAGISVAGAVVVFLIFLQMWCFRRRKGQKVRHRRVDPEKPLELIDDCMLYKLLFTQQDALTPTAAVQPKAPETARRGPLRGLSRVYRPTPARSAQSSKTSSSALTSGTQSSAMFTSVIMLSPALSMVSEESGPSDAASRA